MVFCYLVAAFIGGSIGVVVAIIKGWTALYQILLGFVIGEFAGVILLTFIAIPVSYARMRRMEEAIYNAELRGGDGQE